MRISAYGVLERVSREVRRGFSLYPICRNPNHTQTRVEIPMKPLTRLAVVLATAVIATAACGNPMADRDTPVSRRADEAPTNGGMYGSGHDVVTASGTTVIPEDTTSRIGGGYGSGH